MKLVPVVPCFLPSDSYHALTDKFDVRKSKKTQQLYIAWGLRIIKCEKFNDRMVYYNTPLEGPPGYLKRFLNAIDGQYEGGEFDPNEYLGKKLSIEVDYPISLNGTPSEYPNVVRVFRYQESVDG